MLVDSYVVSHALLHALSHLLSQALSHFHAVTDSRSITMRGKLQKKNMQEMVRSIAEARDVAANRLIDATVVVVALVVVFVVVVVVVVCVERLELSESWRPRMSAFSTSISAPRCSSFPPTSSSWPSPASLFSSFPSFTFFFLFSSFLLSPVMRLSGSEPKPLSSMWSPDAGSSFPRWRPSPPSEIPSMLPL